MHLLHSRPEIMRAQGMPGAVAPGSVVCRKAQRERTRAVTGTTEHSGIPCAMLDDLYRALLGVPGFVSRRPAGALDPEVDTGIGVSGPHGFVERLRALRRPAHGKCPPQPASRS